MSEIPSFNPENTELLTFEPIALELGQTDIETAMELYVDFVHLPISERQKLQGYVPGGPSGYRHKGERSETGQASPDSKHIFHMEPGIEAQLLQSETQLYDGFESLAQESRDFLTAAQEIYHSLTGDIRKKYEELEEEFPGLVGVHMPDGADPAHVLRFVAYEPNASGILARGHYDKKSGTIAIAESQGGLRIGSSPDDMVLLDRGQYDPVFFHGLDWDVLTRSHDIETNRVPGWHDVVDTGEIVDNTVTRWALIDFSGRPGKPTFTEEETHTPLTSF